MVYVMKTSKLLLIPLLLILCGEAGNAQRTNLKRLYKYDLYAADKKEIMDHTVFTFSDSIWTLYMDDKCYFLYRVKERAGELFSKLFSYDCKNKKLELVIDSLFDQDWGLNGLYIFNNNLFLMYCYGGDYDKGKIWGEKIIVFDPAKNKINKEVLFPIGEIWSEITLNMDNLQIRMQPSKAKLNLDHYIFFWMPRGRPLKWHYIETGNEVLYTLDKDFNIIMKEERLGEDQINIY